MAVIVNFNNSSKSLGTTLVSDYSSQGNLLGQKLCTPSFKETLNATGIDLGHHTSISTTDHMKQPPTQGWCIIAFARKAGPIWKPWEITTFQSWQPKNAKIAMLTPPFILSLTPRHDVHLNVLSSNLVMLVLSRRTRRQESKLWNAFFKRSSILPPGHKWRRHAKSTLTSTMHIRCRHSWQSCMHACMYNILACM